MFVRQLGHQGDLSGCLVRDYIVSVGNVPYWSLEAEGSPEVGQTA